MIKVECSSWFVENLLIMLTTRLSLLLASVPFSKCINWVNLRHKSNKLTTALNFYHFKRSVNLEVHLLFFCHLQWGIWSVLVKKIPQFWPFCYIFESIHVIRLKPHWTNKNPEEIPAGGREVKKWQNLAYVVYGCPLEVMTLALKKLLMICFWSDFRYFYCRWSKDFSFQRYELQSQVHEST